MSFRNFFLSVSNRKVINIIVIISRSSTKKNLGEDIQIILTKELLIKIIKLIYNTFVLISMKIKL